jgi:hypothetical protein
MTGQYFPGGFCDVRWAPGGWVLASADGLTLYVWLMDSLGLSQQLTASLPEPILYTRVAATTDGTIIVVGQAHETGRLILARAGAMGPFIVDALDRYVFGQNGVQVHPIASNAVEISQVSAVDTWARGYATRSGVVTFHPLPMPDALPEGTTQGFADVDRETDEVRWVDLQRGAVPGLVLPTEAPPYWIGQAAADPPRLLVVGSDGVARVVYEGLAYEPYCDTAADGRFVCCARTALGAWSAVLTPAEIAVLPPADAEPEPPETEPPSEVLPPAVTIVDYQPREGTSPLRVYATWSPEAHSGPIDLLEWLTRPLAQSSWSVVATNPPSDPDHTFVLTDVGAHELALRARGPGGVAQTGVERLVTVTSPVIPELPEPTPEPPPMPYRDLPHVGNDEIADLSAHMYPVLASHDNDINALLRDGLYYARGYYACCGNGQNHATAMANVMPVVNAWANYPDGFEGNAPVVQMSFEELESLVARLRAVYQAIEKWESLADQDKLRDWIYYLGDGIDQGTYLRARNEGYSHGLAVDVVENTVYMDFGHDPPHGDIEPDGDPPFPIGGESGRAPGFAGRVRVEGRLWKNDLGIFRPVFCSHLIGLSDSVDPAPLLDWIQAQGFNGTRVFGGYLSWTQQTAESARARLPGFLEACLNRGLYCEVTAITDSGESAYDVEQHVREIGQMCLSYPNALLEIANEPYHSTQRDAIHDFNYLRQLRALAPAEVCCALGACEVDEDLDPAYAEGANYVTRHLDRSRDHWNMVRRVRELENVSNENDMPVANDEPIGADESDQEGRRCADPAIFYTMGLLNRIFEVGGNFFCEDGRYSRVPGPRQQECATAFLRGSLLVPTAAKLDFMNATWDGSPIADAAFEGEGDLLIRGYSGVEGNHGWSGLVGIRRGTDGGVVWGWPDRVLIDGYDSGCDDRLCQVCEVSR